MVDLWNILMKFSGKSYENFKNVGIKEKQEKFPENFAEFSKEFHSASFIENTAFYRAEYGLLRSKTYQHCSCITFKKKVVCQTPTEIFK